MKIYVSRNYRKILIFFIFYFTLFIGFFTYNFGLPNSFLYLCDAMMILLMIVMVKSNAKALQRSPMIGFFMPLFILVIIGTLCAIVNEFSFARWIWSVRNWGRLFVFCLICFGVLKKGDCDRICAFTLRLYNINVAIVLIQFLFMKGMYEQDQLNGLFGRETSSIHLTITFVVIAMATAQYMSKKINMKKLLLVMIEIFLVAVIAELRVIPVIVVIISVVAFFATFKMTAQSLGKIVVFALIGVVLITGASHLLKIFYPGTALNYTISGIIKAASTEGGYGYAGGIDRLTFLTVINERIFKGWKEYLFGIGMGNAEYSAISSLCSSFYNSYGKFLSYLNFSSATLYIETGIIGLSLYFVSFLVVLVRFIRVVRNNLNKSEKGDLLFYGIFGVEMTIINLFYIIYNNLQRTDAAYLLGLYLAMAFIGIRGEKYNNA